MVFDRLASRAFDRQEDLTKIVNKAGADLHLPAIKCLLAHEADSDSQEGWCWKRP